MCAHDPTTEKKHIRKFETHRKPRQITESGAGVSKDTFGDVEGEEKIDRGWLTDETIVQFKFFNEPFTVKSKLKNRSIYVKVDLSEVPEHPIIYHIYFMKSLLRLHQWSCE